ncbi:MAG TPA: gluconate:H+ symporter [bacterium]|nr:gluconate:H+ symporter [bacterium]
MTLLIVLSGIGILLVLITAFKLDAFLAFVMVSLYLGLARGLPFEDTISAIQTGIGDTLSSLVMILGFGAMLGKLVADSGAAQRITRSLVRFFGKDKIPWALMLTGFVVGIPMFFSVGFVILIPLVFTIGFTTGLPLLYIGIPLMAAMSVAHGYLPPHPGPAAVVEIFNADMGTTLIYGILIAIPAIIIGGPILSSRMKHYNPRPLEDFYVTRDVSGENLPSAGISFCCALLPVILIGLSGIASLFLSGSGAVVHILKIAGDPVLAMLLSVLVGIYFLGLRRGRQMKPLMEDLAHAVSSITMVFLIIAGAGAFKEVMVQSGVSSYVADMLKGTGLSPLLLGWIIAAAIRISIGSATVAALTAASIMLPMVRASTVSPELMVIAIGAGSLILSHVNDGGFWLVKEYFNLSIRETLLTWTVMETVVAVIGLIGALVLGVFV